MVEGDAGSNTPSILHQKTLLLGDPIPTDDESVKNDGDEVPQIPPSNTHGSEESKEGKSPLKEAPCYCSCIVCCKYMRYLFRFQVLIVMAIPS